MEEKGGKESEEKGGNESEEKGENGTGKEGHGKEEKQSIYQRKDWGATVTRWGNDRVNKDKAVLYMDWFKNEEILCARKDGTITHHNPIAPDRGTCSVQRHLALDGSQGHFIGMASHGDTLTTCSNTGHLTWISETGTKSSFDLPLKQLQNLSSTKKLGLQAFAQHASAPHHIVTGGDDVDVMLWDIAEGRVPTAPLFQAKNVRPDNLDLHQPIHPTSLLFLPDGPNDARKLLCTGRHHDLRLYDTRAQRRPTHRANLGAHPLGALTATPHDPHLVHCADTLGHVYAMDLRRLAAPVYTLRGFAGAVRALQWHPHAPLLCAVGLDRHVHVHAAPAGRGVPVRVARVYVKQRINALLTDALPRDEALCRAVDASAQDVDALWEALPVVTEMLDDAMPRKKSRLF